MLPKDELAVVNRLLKDEEDNYKRKLSKTYIKHYNVVDDMLQHGENLNMSDLELDILDDIRAGMLGG